MFKNLQPLQRDAHRTLRFAPVQPYHFAAQEMLVPITVGEATLVAREYPLVFPRNDQAPPSALVGVREGVNAYVRSSGHWVARYVPAHIRRYPFILAAGAPAPTNGSGRRPLALMFDADAPHLSEATGERLFTPAGEPTPVLQKIQEVLTHLHRDLQRTLRLMAQIQAADLLIEQTLKVQSRSGAPLGLKGLRVIDTQKLAALSPETVYRLYRSGALTLIHAHLLSLSNLRDSPLVHTEAPAALAPRSDTLNFEGIDWSRLGGPTPSIN
jgi:hypothetical protein